MSQTRTILFSLIVITSCVSQPDSDPGLLLNKGQKIASGDFELVLIVPGARWVEATWEDPYDGNASFHVERRRLDEDFLRIGSVPVGEIQFADHTVEPDTDYTYRVIAQKPGSETLVSDRVLVHTPIEDMAGTAP